MDRGRLRVVLLARLRSVGGCADEASRRLGVSRAVFDELLARAGAEGAPARIRDERVVDLPRSRAFGRWFATG